ncbi:mediator of RNA polymerase II transcription subunit 26 isoform X5 [Phalacrocorax aristotelis]|uniref:mediator of RNA polymerase II transcription subunit 26 isoform X5 n=1 Tax=Phalacrocorax aristotelis TaxID=126867 RepID=UPI003F4C047A
MTAAPAPSPQQIRDRLLQAIDPQSNATAVLRLGVYCCERTAEPAICQVFLNLRSHSHRGRMQSEVVMRGTRNNQAAVCEGKSEHQPTALLSFQQEEVSAATSCCACSTNF